MMKFLEVVFCFQQLIALEQEDWTERKGQLMLSVHSVSGFWVSDVVFDVIHVILHR